MANQSSQSNAMDGYSVRLMPALPIALYNAAVVALIVHVASGWLLGLRIAYLGLLSGAACAVVLAGFDAIERIGAARGDAVRQLAITVGAAVAYGVAGYQLHRSYQARFLVDGADLRHLPALVLALIAIASAVALGWVAWRVAHDRPTDLRS